MRLAGDRITQRTATTSRRRVAAQTGTQYRATISRQYPGFYGPKRKITYLSPAQKHANWQSKRDKTVAANKAKRERKQVGAARRALLDGLLDVGEAVSPTKREGGLSAPFGSAFPIEDPLRTLRFDEDHTTVKLEQLKKELRKPAVKKSAEAQARLLWKLAGKYYGGGKVPPTKLGKYPGAAGAAAGWVDSRSPRTVNLEEDYTAPAAGVAPDERSKLAKVLLHEWAHTRQPASAHRKYPRNRVAMEGGAEAYAQYVARLLGLTKGAYPAYKTYPREVATVRKTRGKRYIRRGQFQ